MRISLKFDSAKFSVSNLCFSKVIKEKPLGWLDLPLLVQEGLKNGICGIFDINSNYLIPKKLKNVRNIG